MAFYGKALVLNCELPAACILDPSGFGLPLQGLASDLSWHEQCLVGRQLALAVVFYSFRFSWKLVEPMMFLSNRK